MWVDHVPEYSEASSTKNLLISSLKLKLLYAIVLTLSMLFAPPKKLGYFTLERIEVSNRACVRKYKDSFRILASFLTNK